MSAPILTLDHIQFAYQDRVILHDISIQFQKGQVVAIMGGSGSGKTTILRIIAGLIKAAKGQLAWNGSSEIWHNDVALYAWRKEVGMLFQQGALLTDISVFENIAFPLRELTHLPESIIRDIVLMKLEAVGLRGAHQLMPSALSGGMARRVALARAIVMDPLLIMYDEPFAGLDPISMGVIANLIRRLNDALGATSLLVSHDVDESFAIADFVYFVSQGRIVAQGTPAQLRQSTHPYVQQFIEAKADGPVPFHYPSCDIQKDFSL